ncbi:hypothetical protein QR680_005780 [Steinernema hermaphroditum]|uniref:Uncharacterized protein n=1 Tax=Steinernema hermaphroditum TaxID=289476 RepID=A0AA39HTB5_9BILA|nr:hypothetical protein QR680_005780 [Steinernema hermaphroditum]
MSTALYATSSVGTSPPPSAVRPRLLDSTDSLALFPSVQRRQLRSAEDASVHRPASSSGFHRHFARLNARQAHENMIYSYGNHAGCPVEPTIATSASSYLNDDGRRIEIEKIPHGLVKQNRMLFAGSRPSSVSPQEQSSRMRLSRRTSEPFADEEPPLPRGMPTSSYLLRKSQENLLARRLEDEHGHQDPTYRTIIMFNDRSRSRRATFNAKVHSSPRSRSVGVAEHFVVARPALSVALESSPTPHSSEFLDIITQKKDDSPLSPNTIRRNCKHMMDFVNSRGCSLSPDEEGYESQEGAFKDSATNEEMISMSDALTNSQLLLTELQKPKNVYNSDGSLGSSSPSGSVISDVEIAKLKDDEIRRLEVELGNAQECVGERLRITLLRSSRINS